MQHCPNCGGGELKIIAAILERPVIEKILTHLGLDPLYDEVRVRIADMNTYLDADSLRLSFALPPGSYATAVLAQLGHVADAAGV